MNETPIDDEVEAADIDSPSPRRHDAKPKNAKPKGRKTRDPAARFDSPEEVAIDGWGDPFDVQMKPGWVAFWPTDRELKRMTRRRWEAGCWGDDRIVSYAGDIPGKAGVPITYNEHRLYIMSQANVDVMVARDPRRIKQRQLREALRQRAESSEAFGQRGYMTESPTTL